MFKHIISIILPLFLLAATSCTNINQQPASKQRENNASAGTNTTPQIIKKKTKRELRYLRFANGGIVGYFDDGTVTGCPRCDFCRSNIITMFDEKPYGTYTVESDGSLLINGEDREIPEYHEGDPDGWALIDYKWHIKPPQE